MEEPTEEADKSGGKKEIAEKEGAKKVDDEKESEEIDIYLFSNGQMYSPPRKYHLRTDELQQWEVTLGFLARKHYGSLHSGVELYELDGRKVEDPKYIRDCAVYVAVVPPDPFIYAGYDKYLVKASKSYERRFSKRANGALGETSSPDDTQKDGINISKLSQKFTPVSAPINDNELRPQYPSSRKSNNVRKSSIKNSNQKFADNLKPVANQVSQRSNVPRKLQLRSSDFLAKKTLNHKKDITRNCSIINTTPGVAGKKYLINQSIDKGKTPYVPEPHVHGHSSHKVNEFLPVLTPNSNKINTKKQDSVIKVNTPTVRRTSKLHKSTKKLGQILNVTNNPLVDEIYKERVDHPNDPMYKPNTSLVNNFSKQAAENQTSTINKNPLLKTSNNLASRGKIRILPPNKKPTTEDKMQGPPVSQMTIMTNTRASMVDISSPTSKEYTLINKATKHENVKEELQRTYSTSASGRASTPPENKMSIIEEIDKEQGSKTTQIKILEEESTLINKKTAENDMAIEQLTNKYKGLYEDETPKYTNKDRISAKSESKIFAGEEIFLTLDKNHEPVTTQSIKFTSDVALSLKPFLEVITKQKNSSPSVETKIISVTDTSSKITEDQSTKRPEIESLTNKIKLPTVEPDSNTVKGNKINNTRDKLQKNEIIQNVNDANAHETESIVNDIKLLMPIPENTIKYTSNTLNDKASASQNAYIYGDSNEIIIQVENVEATKTHSFTFYNKMANVNNTVKVADMKSNTKDIQESITVPITNIVQDKDIVHINAYKNSVSESNPMKKNKAGALYERKHYIENAKTYKLETLEMNADSKVPNDKDMTAVESPSNIPLKEAEIKTTYMNPKWDGNSATIVHDPPSKDLIRNFIDPNTNQLLEFVQSGDIVNVKFSIQIRKSEGIQKSTQKINMEQSNSDTQVENDDFSKTPNELTRSKSLQSLEDDAPHLCCRKDKVVVYQCACCTQSDAENSNYNSVANPLFPGQGFYFLLPVVMPAQDSARVSCQTCDKQVQHTESFIKTSLNICNKETLISVPGDGDNTTCIKLSNMSQNIKFNEKFVYDNSTKRQVAISGPEVEQSRVIMMRTDPSQTSARYNMETKQQQTTTITQDQFTQTDWCDVLLEARAEPDGHYTFYLPPLHLIQQYSLR